MALHKLVQTMECVWDTIQVELKGEYPPERVIALHEYTTSTSWWRIAAVILLTPLPSLAYICLPETVNLDAATLGMHHNWTFFGRFFLSYTMWCLLQTHMISTRMPLLSLSRTQLVISAVLVAAASTGFELLYAWTIGFPVPFTIHMMAVPYVSLMFFALAIAWYPHVRQNPALLWKIADASLICVCHGLVIIGYPLYYYQFIKMGRGIPSAAFSLLLPVLKIGGRVLFYYLCKSAAGDRITVTVVFNPDLVNALFVSFCMQYQPSLMTTVGLMIANALQVVLMIRDIDSVRKRIAITTQKIIQLRQGNKQKVELPGRLSAAMTMSMLPRAVDIFQRYSFSGAIKPAASKDGMASIQIRPPEQVLPSKKPRRISFFKPTRTVAPTPVVISPSTSNLQIEHLSPSLPLAHEVSKGPTSVLVQLEQLERSYAALVRKLMYASEFAILTAFAEVITPIVYSLYLIIIFHMPNCKYYTQFANMSTDHLIRTVLNVLLYSLVELTAFTTLNQILKRRLNFSTMHQLAFVLDRQTIHVQSALILWVFYTTQISLDHYGTDYTFKFDWLKDGSNGE